MALARYVVDAVLLEGRSAREVAAAHGISKSWIYVLIERFRAGGYEALEPRCRHPRSCSTDYPPRYSATTAPCSQALPATARSPCKQSSSASVSRRRTHGPITHRPVARSSACTRRSSAICRSSHQRARSRTSRPSSTPFSTTTTTSARTGPLRGAHRCRPTAHASRLSLQASSRTPTSESAKTRSMPPARSACATSAASTKSVSDELTRARRSSSSSPTERSA
jgi:hypothetical protein